MKYCVYALLDPRINNAIFYIGKGSWLIRKGYKNRYYAHIAFAHNGKKSPLYSKIRKIESFGLEVGFKVLSQWENEEAAYAEEKRWIAAIGLELLTNLTEGGKGASLNEDARRKISEAQKGKKLSEETRRKMSLAKRGQVISEEQKKKISLKNKGRKRSAEFCRQCAERTKGKPSPMEGKKHTEETKAKFKNRTPSMLGKRNSAETIRKRVEANKGFKHSEETKKKLSIISHERGINPKAIEAMRQANLGNQYSLGYKHTEEAKKRISEAVAARQTGKPSAMKGKHRSEETKHRMLLAQQRKRLAEARRKLLIVLQQMAA